MRTSMVLIGMAAEFLLPRGASADVTQDDLQELLRIRTSEAEIGSDVEAHRPPHALSAEDFPICAWRVPAMVC